jgi:hypothetical protein
MWVYGFSNNKMTRLRGLVSAGIEKPVHGNKCAVKLTAKKAEAIAFMKAYFELNTDKQPDPAGNTDAWHLPSTTTKEEVWEMYKSFFHKHGKEDCDLVSRGYFKRLWLKEFPHVTIPVRSRFKQCTE